MRKTLIIIPAYNKDKKIGDIILKLKQMQQDFLIIDDGSTDKTYEILQRFNITFIHNNKNLGVGFAIKKGIIFAIKKNYTHIITIDGDGQHPIEKLPIFLNKLKQYDFIIGNRFSYISQIPKQKIINNFFCNIILKEFFNIKIKDCSSGYRGFKIHKEMLNFANNYGFIYDLNFFLNNKPLHYINIEPIYNDKDLTIKYSEIEAFFNTLLKYKNIKLIKNALKKIQQKQSFSITIKNQDFDCHYIKYTKSYLILSSIERAINYYKSLNLAR